MHLRSQERGHGAQTHIYGFRGCDLSAREEDRRTGCWAGIGGVGARVGAGGCRMHGWQRLGAQTRMPKPETFLLGESNAHPRNEGGGEGCAVQAQRAARGRCTASSGPRLFTLSL